MIDFGWKYRPPHEWVLLGLAQTFDGLVTLVTIGAVVTDLSLRAALWLTLRGSRGAS